MHNSGSPVITRSVFRQEGERRRYRFREGGGECIYSKKSCRQEEERVRKHRGSTFFPPPLFSADCRCGRGLRYRAFLFEPRPAATFPEEKAPFWAFSNCAKRGPPHPRLLLFRRAFVLPSQPASSQQPTRGGGGGGEGHSAAEMEKTNEPIRELSGRAEGGATIQTSDVE